ncbi:MAG: phosphatidylserine decarboxylase [Acidobacteriota bacterium]|nr:phosphatidylserine decarboxylase [Acidobacteriota bacterium]
MMSFAKEAWPFVVPVAAIAALLLLVGWRTSAILALAFALCILLFFRIPQRRYEGRADALLSPASGRVTAIDTVSDASVGPGTFTRIVTFLSVFDIHVQRAPADAEVVAIETRSGRKVAAFKPEAGDVNESRLTVFRLESGDKIGVRQVVGLVARRIVGYVDEGDSVGSGDLIGLIKFGSRVDLLVPQDYSILVSSGQKVSDGLTPMAAPGSRIVEHE